MFTVSELKLAEKSRFFRYVFYLISGFRLTSFHTWTQEGEPNPFVKRAYRQRQTRRVEFTDIFEDLDKKNKR